MPIQQLLFLVLWSGLITMPAFAQTEENEQGTPSRVEAPKPLLGKWQKRKNESSISEETSATIWTISEFTNIDSKPVVLVITCPNQNLDLYIDWNVALGGQTNVFTSIDRDRIQSRAWRMAVGDQATYYSGVTIDFIQELLQGQILNAEIVPASGKPVSASIVLEGMAAAMNFLKQHCRV